MVTSDSLKGKKPHLIAMVHVHTINVLTNTVYNDLLNVETYRVQDLQLLQRIRSEMNRLHKGVVEEYQIDILKSSKSSIFVLKPEEVQILEEELIKVPFVQSIIERALSDVEIYTRNGIEAVEIENTGAPYFIGDEVPFEELAILNIVCKALRNAYPDIMMGIHVLAGDELESLPIAIASESYFIRSEASVFSGFRPEGRTINKGNLAKFFYLRNFFNAYLGVEDPKSRRYPQIWSDLQKKHTVFEEELSDLNIWLSNILFLKLEGVILTGTETGKDIDEKDFALSRAALEKHKEMTKSYFGHEISLPLITGSGLNVDMYKKYADFIITGTQLKTNKYWENEVSEEGVKELVGKFR